MKAYVVDENVPIVANDNSLPVPRAPQADHACRLACIKELRRIVKRAVVVIDDDGEVLSKYRRYLHTRGQPGVGDAFLKHVFDNQYNRRKVCRVKLEKKIDGTFEAFPTNATLAKFDASDRIFVALALSSQNLPVILNAVDSDYAEHKASLDSSRVRVKELCPHCLRDRRVSAQ